MGSDEFEHIEQRSSVAKVHRTRRGRSISLCWPLLIMAKVTRPRFGGRVWYYVRSIDGFAFIINRKYVHERTIHTFLPADVINARGRDGVVMTAAPSCDHPV